MLYIHVTSYFNPDLGKLQKKQCMSPPYGSSYNLHEELDSEILVEKVLASKLADIFLEQGLNPCSLLPSCGTSSSMEGYVPTGHLVR